MKEFYKFMDYDTKEDITNQIIKIFNASNNLKEFEIEVNRFYHIQQVVGWNDFKKIVNDICKIF